MGDICYLEETQKKKLIFGLKMGNKVYLVYSDVCVLSQVWLCNLMDCSPPDSSVHGIFR